jgi:MFS family permease
MAGYLAVVQLLFALCWIVYVIFLPALLESAGLARAWVPWLLALDQAIFATMDLAMGIAADQVRRRFARIAPAIVVLTLVSCLAFLLLPYTGAVSPSLLLGLVILWAVTASALRAPPWLLFARHAARPGLPMAAAINLCGLGVAAALAPYLGLLLRGQDPRVPFVLASVVLALTVSGLSYAERRANDAVESSPPAAGEGEAGKPVDIPYLVALFGVALVLGIGFQVHVFMNAGPLYQRFGAQVSLDWLLPVFWIGFSFSMFPGAGLAMRFGLWPVLTWGAIGAAVAASVVAIAGSLELTVAAQLVCGGAWGAVLMATCSAALRLGFKSREGLAVGLLWSGLACAALLRFAVGLAELPKIPTFREVAPWIPPLCWALGALLIALVPRAARRN